MSEESIQTETAQSGESVGSTGGPVQASKGQTIIFLVVGIAVYIGIQWLMPKVGMNS